MGKPASIIRGLIYTRLFFVLLSAILLLISAAMYSIPRPDFVPQDLWTESRLALIIAAIFTFFIELAKHSWLIVELEKVASDIRRAQLDATISGLVADEISQQINESILRDPYVLKDMSVDLTFEKQDNSEILLLTDSTRFKVHNLTRHPVIYEFKADETTELEDTPQLKSLIIGGNKYQVSQLLKKKWLNQERNTLKIKMAVQIPPGDKDIEIEFQVQKYVRSSDSDFWNVTDKTVNLRIVCRVPAQLEVRAFCEHPDETKFYPHPQENPTAWELLTGILPYQGIRLAWRESKKGL